MNLVRFQDIRIIYKKQLRFYMLATNYQKHLGINMTEDMNNPHTENYRALLTEIKDINKWRDKPLLFILLKYKLTQID